ncbi:uncharacterized protein LOC116768224 isoform X3 [Danaus plexippus]|uniref:uncharacterized protein LOC116768224 isoform X3 n=1 Tax=Danaus plexippus TaxID=13037 RepID=UPI002AB30577|nr:uncharacterized protein LOC116768224 isoform X3 [Danaus plexippus]
MGVFKWLRRERLTVTTGRVSPASSVDDPPVQVGTIRTEEYKRDLAEFQARRSIGSKDVQDTPNKKKCGRHSLPVSCTNCTGDPDATFNYEKKSAMKYKKKSQKRTGSIHSEEKLYEGAPNIHFLFQNQVFMPGNMFASYSEPRKQRKHRQRSPDFLVQKQIDFKDDQPLTPPLFYKDSSLPFDTKNFLELSRSDDELDGVKTGDAKKSSEGSGSHKNDSCDVKLWEVMSELKHFDKWADEQLQAPSTTSKSDDSRSDTSAFGLPIASACNLDVTIERNSSWSLGKWGVVPVQIKRLNDVTVEHVRKKWNMEINILRKFRHPNIILLMGVYPDVQNNVHLICERCIDSLYGMLHMQGRILSIQTSIHYTLDITNALVFLNMQGYLHTALTSKSIMITAQDIAKIADLQPCTRLTKKKIYDKGYDTYKTEPHYTNISDNRTSSESEPLLTQRSDTDVVSKPYDYYLEMTDYNWQAPELFEPDEGMVHPCNKSDVYSLCLILWECCNASVPWKTLNYAKLKELYTLWRTGLQLPRDGSYPGCILAVLEAGLKLDREHRIDLGELQVALQKAKHDLDEIEYIILPEKIAKKKSSFSTQPWDTTSPTDSDYQSPKSLEHTAVVHKHTDSSTGSDNEVKSSHNETLRKTNLLTSYTTEKCFVSDEEDNVHTYHSQIKDYSSACSTPIAKLRARIRDIETPGTLHRSDSTEYCSIVSPDTRLTHFGLNDDTNRDEISERSTAKLSRSFTPKSYKPLHIKVPEYNLDSIKTILKDRNGNEKSSYNFDIKNYSLPTTPIARSNKLRKNAWLSGDVDDRRHARNAGGQELSNNNEETNTKQSPEDSNSTNNSLDKEEKCDELCSYQLVRNEVVNYRNDIARDSFTGLKRISDPPEDFIQNTNLERARSLNCVQSIKYKIEEDLLANVNVKPLVAIHEKWIYEANKKTGRSLSMPEDNNKRRVSAVKPASHCTGALQKSLSQHCITHSLGSYQPPNASPTKSGNQWEQYRQKRDVISKTINFHPIDTKTYRKAAEKGTLTENIPSEPKVDRGTDTASIEDYIRDLIRKEFRQMMDQVSYDEVREDMLDKGVTNIVESLKGEPEVTAKRESVKTYSTIKINGNSKPLLQITFSRSGDNQLQVLDSCVNVTICDAGSGRDEPAPGDQHHNSLKRCQAFSALQVHEARSTEDLYIDDEMSTNVQDFGKVKLIPLHGSIHEILCDKDDCCLIKLKQENGCDTIYFRCDDSIDAVDGPARHTDLVFKRSISIEERIHRLPTRPRDRTRPKSEILLKAINNNTRPRSNSSPCLFKERRDDVELNIESVAAYNDSSSDECLKCSEDDFETLEREIEEDLAKHLSSLTSGGLEKISEENLSTIADDLSDKR